jgi:hypothetical protein
MPQLTERPPKESETWGLDDAPSDHTGHINVSIRDVNASVPSTVWNWLPHLIAEHTSIADVDLTDMVSRDATGERLHFEGQGTSIRYWFNIRHTSAQMNLDEILTQEAADISNLKLKERVAQFGIGHVGKEPVSPSIECTVNDLVDCLCLHSDTVSATVSNDGALSIAAVFPNEIRLYLEIETDGSTEAAVTRERRYARDISIDTVEDLTPEVILAAIGSI